MKIKTITTLAGLFTIGSVNAALTVVAADATYVRSGGNSTTNFQTSSTNVANDNGTDHRIAFYTFDFSANIDAFTTVTLNITENAGGGTDLYQVYGFADGTIDLTTITWDSANTDGYVSANRPTGTALSTFNADGGGANYDVALDSAIFAADADGLVTLAIVDNTLNPSGIGWTDGATLTLSAVPEPSSALLSSIALLGLLRRRR